MDYSVALANCKEAPIRIEEINPNTVHTQWAFFHFMDVLGWAEHTGDWDWWIEVTLTNGETIRCDCGSSYVGMTDNDGRFWTDPMSYDLPFHDPDHHLVSVTILRYNDSEDDLSEEERENSVTFQLSEITAITIGYDT